MEGRVVNMAYATTTQLNKEITDRKAADLVLQNSLNALIVRVTKLETPAPPAPTLPVAPTNLVATSGDKKVSLVWGAV